jgi:hypothetical protein
MHVVGWLEISNVYKYLKETSHWIITGWTNYLWMQRNLKGLQILTINKSLDKYWGE